jgi:multidrug resistance efflux pump
METKPNRAWVKDAAIVFLVILLVLTFFSNTIMNHSLPEVATQMVSNGTITAKVRGTGTVTAVGTHKVKATESITIGRVLVKSGQEVNAGDVLFVLGAADSSKLEEAYATLEDLQASYAQQAASSPILSQFVEEQNAVEQAYQDYEDAEDAYNTAKAEETSAASSAEVKKLLQQKSDTETALTKATQELDKEKLELSSIEAALAGAKSTYTTLYTQYLQQNNDTAASNENPGDAANNESGDGAKQDESKSQTVKTVTKEEVDQAEQKVKELEQQKSDKEAELVDGVSRVQYISNKQYEVDTLTQKLTAINTQLTALGGNASNVEALERAMNTAYNNYLAKQEALNNKLASQNQSVAASSASLTAISNKIKRQQEKIKKLSGEGDSNTITANVSGTVTEVNCTAGDSMIKDDILCAIEVPDQGYTVSFSVTNDQAKRLHVGDTATISNYYWGNEIVATLSSIQTDKKKPMTNKTLTFNLEGDVTSGSELTISVGQKSANYDTIIPNSAIRSDSNGSFVLAVTAKNSPLGNRYIAKRVKIEVLAQDDNNAAVTADLSNGDYVITTSSAPISSGDMVRLADSEK